VDPESGSACSILGFATFNLLVGRRIINKILNFCIAAKIFTNFRDQWEKAFLFQPLWVLFFTLAEVMGSLVSIIGWRSCQCKSRKAFGHDRFATCVSSPLSFNSYLQFKKVETES
jgi:hypothetical protein